MEIHQEIVSDDASPAYHPCRRRCIHYCCEVGVGGGLRVEPRVRGDGGGGAVRSRRPGGEPRVQRRLPLQRLQGRPLHTTLPRVPGRRRRQRRRPPGHRPGLPLPLRNNLN